eukprot:5924029-Pyramimonas_sp.AAC.1
MGITLRPRQFDATRNLHAGQWHQEERERGEIQTAHDAVNPVHGQEHDLSPNSPMDNIADIHAVVSSRPPAQAT